MLEELKWSRRRQLKFSQKLVLLIHRGGGGVGSGQVGERVELAGCRSLGLHGGEASGSTRLKKKKRWGGANLLRHTLSTFHHNWGLFLLD